MAIQSYRLPNGEEIIFDEWLPWPLYSVVEWAAASPINLFAFSYVAGQRVPSTGLAARNSTLADTNMQSPKRMNHDEGFRLFSWTYEIFGLSADEITASPDNIQVNLPPAYSALNLRRLQRDLMVALFVGEDIDKPKVKCPFEYVHQGIGPVAYSSGDSPMPNDAPPQAFSHGTGGQVAWKHQRRFNLPVAIPADTSMSVRIWSPTSTVASLSQDTRVRWWLEGIKHRPALG